MHVHALMHTHTGDHAYISHIHMQGKRRRGGEQQPRAEMLMRVASGQRS